MDKKIIMGNFSRNAASYDDHASIQRRCADEIMTLLGDNRFSSILEIGCGTGSYTKLLRDRYPDAKITAIDISKEMVDIARKKYAADNIQFKICDGEHIEITEKYDLITSNASFQWFEHLDVDFKVFSEILEKGGVLCFSMYGPDTFVELKEVFKSHFGRRNWLSSSRFATLDTIEQIVKRYFGKFKLSEEYFTVDFYALWDLLLDIKRSGTRGEGLGNSIVLGKYVIKEMEKTYVQKFGRVRATHHVYFCRAEV
ncbi:MAG: malonyl-ACP O-methyltransferase BioC [Candidatus Omnitrophota bacterium]